MREFRVCIKQIKEIRVFILWKVKVVYPVTVSKNWGDGAILFDAIDVHFVRTDHEVDVHLAIIDAMFGQFFRRRFSAALQVEAVDGVRSLHPPE